MSHEFLASIFSSPSFIFQWPLRNVYKHTFMPIKRISASIFRETSDSHERHTYPYNKLPPLDCHVSPPLAVINAGQKLDGMDLQKVAQDYWSAESGENEESEEMHENVNKLRRQLELLRDIWQWICNAEGDAAQWRSGHMGKQDGDQFSGPGSSERSRKRSRRRSRNDTDISGNEFNPSSHPFTPQIPTTSNSMPPSSGVTIDKQQQLLQRGAKRGSTASLTEETLSRLGKRSKTANEERVMQWAVSIQS